MTMIDPATGWFEIVEAPTYNLGDIMYRIDGNIDKSSARVGQLLINTWLCR